MEKHEDNKATDSLAVDSASAGSIPPDVQVTLDQVSDRHAAAVLAWAREDARLSKLPLLDLIREVLLSDEGDSLLVVELMNRACPRWEEMIIDEGSNRENTH